MTDPPPKGKPMSIVITGAIGQPGRLVVEQLMAAHTPRIPPSFATGRDTDKLTALAGDGSWCVAPTSTNPETLTDAFAGND